MLYKVIEEIVLLTLVLIGAVIALYNARVWRTGDCLSAITLYFLRVFRGFYFLPTNLPTLWAALRAVSCNNLFSMIPAKVSGVRPFYSGGKPLFTESENPLLFSPVIIRSGMAPFKNKVSIGINPRLP